MEARRVYVLLVVITGVFIAWFSSRWPNFAIYPGLFFLFALGAPILYWRASSNGSGEWAESRVPERSGREKTPLNTTLLGSVALLVLSPLVITVLGFTIDVGRPPGPTEIALNLFKGQVFKHQWWGYGRYIYYDGDGHLRWTYGPADAKRSADAMNAAGENLARWASQPDAQRK